MVDCSDNYSEMSLADAFFASSGLPTVLSYVQNKVVIFLDVIVFRKTLIWILTRELVIVVLN